jgi:uncharacterized protein (DUF1684 family)
MHRFGATFDALPHPTRMSLTRERIQPRTSQKTLIRRRPIRALPASLPLRNGGALALLFLLFSSSALAQLANPAYRASVEKWREDYEASLKAGGGWLSVCGMFWLQEGENRFGSDPLNDIVLPGASISPQAGAFDFRAGKVTVHLLPGVAATLGGKPVVNAELLPDSPQGQLVVGDLTLLVHASGGRFAIRVKDPNCRVRREFTSLHWFPIDESYRVIARFVPYDPPMKVEMQNLAGDTVGLTSPGYVTFSLRGMEYRLEAVLDDPHKPNLFLVFRDLTSNAETYPAARFLDTDPPKDGAVVLDFNKAYNPPCAYNPYTTCPLPPAANRLRTRIEAGEKKYNASH